MRGFLPFVAAGALFGAGLAVGGMTNPAKITGFLDVTGRWDPSLAFVMMGALLVFAVANVFIRRRGAPLLVGAFPDKPANWRLDRRLVLGSVTFGVGWGLVGFCPGPAITSLAGLHVEAVVFVAAMAAGMVVARYAFGADSPV